MDSMHQDMLQPLVEGHAALDRTSIIPTQSKTLVHLPPEIILRILSYLDIADLLPCQTVSSKMRYLSRMVLMDELSGLGPTDNPLRYESRLSRERLHYQMAFQDEDEEQASSCMQSQRHGHSTQPLPVQGHTTTELPPLPPNYYSTASGAFHPYSASSPSTLNYFTPNINRPHHHGSEADNHWAYRPSKSPTLHQEHSTRRLSSNISMRAASSSSSSSSSSCASRDANYVAPRSMALFLYPHHDHAPTAWQERQTINLTCVGVDRAHEQLIFAPSDEHASRMRFQSNTWSVPPIPLSSMYSILNWADGNISSSSSTSHARSTSRSNSPRRTKRTSHRSRDSSLSPLPSSSRSPLTGSSNSGESSLPSRRACSRSPTLAHRLPQGSDLPLSEPSTSCGTTLASKQGSTVRDYYEKPWEMCQLPDSVMPSSTVATTSKAAHRQGPSVGLNLFDYETGQLRVEPASPMASNESSNAQSRFTKKGVTEPIGLGFSASSFPPEVESTSTLPSSSAMSSESVYQEPQKCPSSSSSGSSVTMASVRDNTTRHRSTVASPDTPWATVNGIGGEHYSVIGIRHGDWPKDRVEEGRWWGGGLHTSLVQESMLLLPLSPSLSGQRQSTDLETGRDIGTGLFDSGLGLSTSIGSSYGTGSSTPLSQRMCISSDDESTASLSHRSRSSSIDGARGATSHGFTSSNSSSDAIKGVSSTHSKAPVSQYQHHYRRLHDLVSGISLGLSEADNDDVGDGSIRDRAAAIFKKEEHIRQQRKKQQQQSNYLIQNSSCSEGHELGGTDDSYGDEDEDSDLSEDSDGDYDDDDDDLEFNGLTKTHLHKMYLATSSPRGHPPHHIRYLCVHHDRNTMFASHHDLGGLSSPYVSAAEPRGAGSQNNSYLQLPSLSHHHTEKSVRYQSDDKVRSETSPKMIRVGNRHLSIEYTAQVVETDRCSYCYARPCKANVEVQVQFGLVRVSLDWILSGFSNERS
ncbi:hypothetical protein BGW42_001378 [Actinomortierella wolfii]|nr:hypothetical protein BGW42_001378 [Actinomortierella wolfii]